MKTLDLENDREEFHKFFSELKTAKQTIIAWQMDPETQKRNIFYSVLSDVLDQDNSISLNTMNDEAYNFSPDEVYFYIESHMSIFKASQIATQNNSLSVHYPEQLKLLDDMEDDRLKAVFTAIDPKYVQKPPTVYKLTRDGDKGYGLIITNFDNITSQSDRDKKLFETELSFVTLDEEDKKFEGQRSTPRSRPPEGKMVTIKSKTHDDKQKEILSLFDLSRGGLGFMSFAQNAYEVGEELYVIGFDANDFEQPMVVVVRSVREADEMKTEFKVGCQFIT